MGSQFTYHHQVVAYAHYLADQRKDVAQWISYGKTNEDRELGQMIITSPELKDSLDIYKNGIRMSFRVGFHMQVFK